MIKSVIFIDKTMDVTKKLIKLGLSEKEASLYLAGLSIGPATILQLSRHAQLKRGTVYEIITNLVSLGFFTKTLKNKKIRYVPSDPNILKVIQNEREGLLESIFPLLRQMSNPLTQKPQVYFFDDIEDIKKIHTNYLKVQKGEMFGLEDSRLAALFGKEWITDYIKRRKKLGIRARSIMEHSAHEWVERGEEDYRTTKLLPKDRKFEISIEIFDEAIVLTSLKNEILCIAIENKLVADAMRTMFEIMWDGI
jgi:sugar-specific transcriptional regulator TrmB